MGKNFACGVVLVVVVAISSSGAEPPRRSPAGPMLTRRVLNLLVVERDGKTPVAGVAIQSLPGRADEPDFRGTTDDQGRCTVPISPDAEKSHHFAVHTWKDGFVPIRVLWGHTREFEFEGIPAAYTVILDRGTPIGGVVRDEHGRPVAGARVFPTFAGTRRSEMEYLDLPWDVGFKTDAGGCWQCAILPASCESGEMGLRVEHPRFVSSGRGYDRRLAIKDVRALTAALAMETGFTLRGTVTDQKGKPIAGATVVWRGADQDDGVLRVKSGAGGRFQFENRPPGIALITVEVPGLATEVKQVWLGPPDPNPRPHIVPVFAIIPGEAKPPAEGPSNAPTPFTFRPADFASDATQLAKDGPCEPPLVFRLGRGRTIRGRVVDTSGRPIAGAGVTPEFKGRSDVLDWRAQSGADGCFQWTNAPAPLLLGIGPVRQTSDGRIQSAGPPVEVIVLNVDNAATGQKVRRYGPGAQVGEFIVTMPAPFRLRGKVVDAKTARPIDRFRLIEGIVWTHDFAPEDDDTPPDWSLGRSDMVAGGHYEVMFPRLRTSDEAPENYPQLVIRIEAEGYAPATSRRYLVAEGEQNWDVALRKRPWIKGTVRSPEGVPVAGAEVVIAVKDQPAPSIYNGRLAPGWQGDVVRTGPDGRFGFAKPDQGGGIVVVSDRGLARCSLAELAAEPVVTLEPWGRLRGQLRVGTKAGPRRIVDAVVTRPNGREEPAVSFTARALTDADGRFSLDRVAPGHAIVFRPHWFADGTSYRSHKREVDVASGQTVQVMMGGAGRPVVGRVTRAAGLPSFDLGSVTGWLRLVQQAPEFPACFAEWDREKQRAWWSALYKTAEGRTYSEQANAYVVNVDSAGAFRIDDVPKGHYRLKFEYQTVSSELGAEPKDVRHTKVAVLQAYLDVPAGPDEKPLDVGALTLTPPEPEVVDR